MQKYKKFKNNPIFSIYFFYIPKKENLFFKENLPLNYN